MTRTTRISGALVILLVLSVPSVASAWRVPSAESPRSTRSGDAVTTSRQAACRVVAVRPAQASAGKIRATGRRASCAARSRLRVRLVRVAPKPARTVKSSVRSVRNGKVRARARCARGTYRTVATDGTGRRDRSAKRRIRCGPSNRALERRAITFTNEARAAAGCPAVSRDKRLRKAAYRHSADMANRGYFSHYSPEGKNPGQRITAAGYDWTSYAENIAFGQRTPRAVVDAWLASPGHRGNIVNCRYRDIGIGLAYAGKVPYWTQDFGTE